MEPWTAFGEIFRVLLGKLDGALSDDALHEVLKKWRGEKDPSFREASPSTLRNYRTEKYYREKLRYRGGPFTLVLGMSHLCPRLLAICDFHGITQQLTGAFSALNQDLAEVSRAGAGLIADRGQMGGELTLGDEQAVGTYRKFIVERLEIAKNKNDRGTMVECWGSLAAIETGQNNWKAAIEARRLLLMEHQENGDLLQAAGTLKQLGWDQLTVGFFNEALETFRGAKDLWLELGYPDVPQYCDTIDGIATALRAKARKSGNDKGLEEAEALLNESLVRRRELQSKAGISATLHRFGHLMTQVAYIAEQRKKAATNDRKRKLASCALEKALESAKALLIEARNLRKEGRWMLDYCRSTNQHSSLLVTFLNRKQEPEIRTLIADVLDMSEDLKIAVPWFQATVNLLRLERKLKRFEVAISHCKDAMKSVKRMKVSKDALFFKAKLYEQHAKTCECMGDMVGTEISWENARTIWSEQGESYRANDALRMALAAKGKP